jgi:hypothetical protein
MDHQNVPAFGIIRTWFRKNGFLLSAGQRNMNIQDILVFQNPVEGGHLVIDKNVKKKIGPVFRGPQTREPQQQFLDGGPGFQFQDQIAVLVVLGMEGRGIADGESGIDLYPDGFVFYPAVHL